MEILFVFGLGLLISFLGQLPIGTMSITATNITVEEGFVNAWKYSMGVTIIEMIYGRLTLSGVAWIMHHELFFEIVNWLTVAMFMGIGVATIILALRQKGERKALLLNNKLDRFLLGVTMSALNPAQIPFWFVWGTYFISAKLLNATPGAFNAYSVGCGIGTLAGLAVYIYGGNWLVTKMKAGTKMLNLIMGIVFIIAAIAQLYRVLFMHHMQG